MIVNALNNVTVANEPYCKVLPKCHPPSPPKIYLLCQYI